MHSLGISVYPDKSDIKEVYDYMETAAKLGFTRIFTCFLSIPDDKRESYLKEFKGFMDKAHELGFVVAADTNPEVFKLIGATPNNLKPFADLGLDIIRLDGNFGTQGDIAVTRNPYGIKIEFNASMDAGVDLLIKNGGNKDQIIMCHNFFPERYTGLDFDLFQQFNKQWKALNLHTAAFVSSHNDPTIGPWEVFCGLPTVEIMRPLPIEVQARYLLATGDVDDIIVGNYPASTKELEALSKINFQALELRVDEVTEITDNEKYIMYEFAPHWDRYDHSSFMLRSSFPRLQFKNQATVQDSGFGDKKEAKEDKSIPHHDCGKKVFTRGDILVVNDNLAHYRGELEVVLTEIPNDGERNLIGKVKDEDLGLLDFIKPGQITELQVANFLDFRMREYGASGISFESIIASGYRSAMPHGVASEKVIQSGETLTMDFGCYYNHYVSDMTRTIHIGDTTDEEREIYDIVLRSNQALIDAAKAGMTRRDYDKVARDVIVEAGYGDYFTHGIGHGIGLDIHEIPYFGNSDETIEAGMVLTDEPGVYLADKYGVRIEDDIIITENGCELITLAPKELIVL